MKEVSPLPCFIFTFHKQLASFMDTARKFKDTKRVMIQTGIVRTLFDVTMV